jgi:hypothetical protein
MDDLLKGLGALILIPFAILYDAFCWGFVFFKFYCWFVLPVFDLPTITYHASIGLMIFTVLFKTFGVKSELEDNTTKFIVGLIAPWLILSLGWFVGLFIL